MLCGLNKLGLTIGFKVIFIKSPDTYIYLQVSIVIFPFYIFSFCFISEHILDCCEDDTKALSLVIKVSLLKFCLFCIVVFLLFICFLIQNCILSENSGY